MLVASTCYSCALKLPALQPAYYADRKAQVNADQPGLSSLPLDWDSTAKPLVLLEVLEAASVETRIYSYVFKNGFMHMQSGQFL